MTLATVSFGPAGHESTATLTEGGWIADGDRSPLVARILDAFASPIDYGPADGDPVACAAREAAKLLNGTIRFLREPAPIPDGSVY